VTDLHLVRHGQTEWWQGNRFAGWTDVALTELGLAQGEKLGRWAATTTLSRVVSSDLRRAWQTAEPAAAAAGLSVEQDPRLREMNFGDAEGMTAEELTAAYPQVDRDFRATALTHGLPGGETGAQVLTRATAALTEIVTAAGPEDRILLVIHGTLIRLLIAELLGIDPNDYRRRLKLPDNVALTSLRFDPAKGLASAQLLRYNEAI
jgi:probable phosphoglycerate mutase